MTLYQHAEWISIWGERVASLSLSYCIRVCVCAWCPNGFGTHHRHHVKLSYCWATRVLSCSADNGYTKYKESENSRKQRKEIIFFYFLFVLIGENVKRWNANAAQTTRQMSGMRKRSEWSDIRATVLIL